MSLKEELREKARILEAKEQEVKAREEEQQSIFRKQIMPVLQQAADYFRDVVADLNVVKPEIKPTYALGPPSSRLVEFNQQEYSFRENDPHEPTEVFVSCICEFPGPYSRFVSGIEAANDYEVMLRDRGISFHRKTHQNPVTYETEGASFEMEGAMQAGFRLGADISGGRIVVTLQNLEDRPTRQYFLQPSRFDEEFLESLGRLLLREEDQLLRSELSATSRNQLQREVEQNRDRQEKDLARALAEIETQRKAQEDARPMNRALSKTRSLLRRVIGRGSSSDQ